MKKLLFILFASIIAFSCSSNDDNNNVTGTTPPVLNNGLKLKRVISSKGTLTYEYNNEGYLTKMIQDDVDYKLYENHYIYSNDKLVRIDHIDYENEIAVVTTPEFFEYNGDLMVKSIIQEGNIYQETYYTYDNNSNLKSRDEHHNGKSQGIRYFEYLNGNIIKETSGNYITTYTYDNKNNPFYSVLPNAYIKAFEYSKNNLISDGYTLYSYEYNDKGYPIKKIENQGDFNNIIEFEYY